MRTTATLDPSLNKTSFPPGVTYSTIDNLYPEQHECDLELVLVNIILSRQAIHDDIGYLSRSWFVVVTSYR